jgi:CheY-like chemotaxis protein
MPAFQMKFVILVNKIDFLFSTFSPVMIFCKTAWLVDDDELCNFLTAHTLQSKSFCAETRSFTNAQQALDELEASVGKETFPDFIFLDLNMPVLDGWGFLEAYHKLPKELKESCTLYILSSSIDEEDVKRAHKNEDVRDFITKPLTYMNLEVIKFQAQDR